MKISLNNNWIFHDFQTNEIKPVNLPHDATIGTERDPQIRNYFLSAGFKGGKYEYITHIDIPENYSDKVLWLHFDGVYRNATVYVNGERLHFQEYGYIQFDVRIENYIRFGEDNEIKVEIDTPSEAHSRWYAGSGIYRSVYLCVAEKTHIKPYGVKITTLSHSPAKILVETDVEGKGYDNIAVEVYGGDKPIKKAEGNSVEIEIENAKLWSAETPYLYRIVVTLVKDGKVIDEREIEYGIRTIEWSAEKGFLINGERTLLRGGCIHADNGVIGMVTNNVTEERRVLNIKKAGFNAIRSAHHPMSEDLLNACDKYGLFVMDETFDTWYRMKQLNGDSKHFEATYAEDTKAMVLNDINHPCVVIYSIGNEIPEIGSKKALKYAEKIIDIIKSIDKIRPLLTCPAMNTARAYVKDTPYMDIDEDEFTAQSEENKKFDWQHYIWVYTKALSNNPTAKIGAYPEECIEEDERVTKELYGKLDLAGYNYYTDKFETLHKLHPERLLVGTETRANLIVNNWELTKKNKWIVGDFIWTLQDHIGEVNVSGLRYANEASADGKFDNRNYPWLLNGSGMIDLLGDIRPAINKFRFVWGGYKGLYLATQPPVHGGCQPEFNSYNWTDTVESWTYEGYEGNKTFIDVYSDAYEVELFVNGKSLGKQKTEEYFAKFPAVYAAGEVVGVGYDKEGKEIYKSSIKTAGKETQLTVLTDKKSLKANGEDFVFIDIAVTDINGVIKFLPDRKVTVEVEGNGVLQGFGSANPVNSESFTKNTHTTYNGKLLAVVRSSNTKGEIKIKISSDGLKDVMLSIPVE